jgi:Flp pilus assembly protein TadG
VTNAAKRAVSRVASLSDSRGSAYVEFIIALVPMFTVFWGFAQLNGMLLADLVVRHAAVNAVRAAIVCDSDAHPQDGAELAKPGGCSYEAAKKTLSAIKSFSPGGSGDPQMTVSVDGAKTTGNDDVTVTVTAFYHCLVPFVGGVVCGLSRDELGSGQLAVAPITRKATLPNQGANYAF